MPLNLNIDVKSGSITKLIEVVARYVEIRHEPKAIVLKAEAQAKASVILAQANAEAMEITARAAQRLLNTETRRQENIESITAKAVRELPENASEEPVSPDWIARFYENCQDIGETDLQELWARLLADEVAQPRSFSRRTMDTLRSFSTADAKVVTTFNECVFTEKNSGINFVFVGLGSYGGFPCTAITDIESHLISLGLLNSEEESPPCLTDDWHIDYCGKEFIMPINPWSPLYTLEGRLPTLAIRRFTVVGNELLKIVPRSPNHSFLENNLKVQFRNSQNQLLTSEEFRDLKDRREKNKRSGS